MADNLDSPSEGSDIDTGSEDDEAIDGLSWRQQVLQICSDVFQSDLGLN